MKTHIGKIKSPFDDEKIIEFVRLTIDTDSIEIEFSSAELDYNNKNIIQGIFNNLGEVTFFQCQNIGKSFGSGAKVMKFRANYMFQGEYFENIDTLRYKNVKIVMPALLDWTKMSVIKNEIFSEKKITIEFPEKIILYDAENYFIEIFTSYGFSSKRENNEIILNEFAGVNFESKGEGLLFWEYLDLINDFRKLFFILSNKETKLISTTFYNDINNPVILHWEGNKSLGKPNHLSPSIEFENTSNRINHVIKNWREKKDIHSSIDLILEKSINPELSRENYFLNTCFSIETFHRRFKNSTIFEKKKFCEIKKSILSTIVDDDIKTLIQNSFAYLNEPNFRARLIDFENDFKAILPKDWDVTDFIRRIVKSRNYLVHRSSKENVFDSFEMLYAAFYLETITKINIYRILGIEENIILDIIKKSEERITGIYFLNKRMRFDN